MLAERPRHGYDIIRVIADRFGGVHAPSPGTIYPALDLLSDQGYVAGLEQEGRRVFTITPVGQEFLQQQSSAVQGIRQRMDGWWAPVTRAELRHVHAELKVIHQIVAQRGGEASEDALERVGAIVTKARQDVEHELVQ